ncbi:hypothetical protein DMH04_14075 [Kibdelosporangium aridum]|uniref:Uncharacterized protein n=2 Tax=Kibdelosporangium aridum TaxID=2030 RepID=A0A428ZE20_KIBAR|nr:hypothetical protein DMH04_14075 [Kibdelosporangium aridum]
MELLPVPYIDDTDHPGMEQNPPPYTILGEARNGIDSIRASMAQADQQHGLNQSGDDTSGPFCDKRPDQVPGLRMYAKFETAWTNVRLGLEQAMADTVVGIDDLSARLRQTAQAYHAGELTVRDNLISVANDLDRVMTPRNR